MNKNIILETSNQNRTIDLTDIGGIKFEEDTHKYTFKNIVYKGVTTLLHRYEHGFNDEIGSFNSAIKKIVIDKYGEEKFLLFKKYCKEQALKTNNENSKYIYGHDYLHIHFDKIVKKYPELEDLILAEKIIFYDSWKSKSSEAIRVGSLEHDKREADIKKNGYIHNGIHYPYIEGKNILSVTEDDICVIPECLVWNHRLKLGGLADVFLFYKGVILVDDYKTNETIAYESFNRKPMKGVCSTLMDSNYYHYSLQLRIYQEMALLLRPNFKRGGNRLISTASEQYNRPDDVIHDCFNVEKEVKLIFEELELETFLL